MANKITPEDIALAKQLEEIITKIQETNKVDLEQKIQFRKEEKTLGDLLKDKFDKQAKYLTNAEIEVDLLERRQVLLQAQLDAIRERERVESDIEKIQERLAGWDKEKEENRKRLLEIEKDLATADEDKIDSLEAERKKLEVIIDTEKARYAALKKDHTDLNTRAAKLRDTEGETADNIKEQVKQGNILLAQGNQRKSVTQAVKATTDNVLASTLGIKNASSTLGDHFIDAAFGAKKFKDIADGINKSLKETLTLANGVKAALGAAKALANKALAMLNPLGVMKDIVLDLANTEAIFTKATGFANKFGNELTRLKELKSVLLLAELDKSFTSLIQNSMRFTLVNDKMRKQLAETAGLFARLGLSTETFSKSLDRLSYTFGMNAIQIKAFTGQLMGFHRAIGIDVNAGLSEFNKQMDLIATHGVARGTAIFKELQLNVKATGIAMQDLINAGKKFDTFDSAMDSAGKLNTILQGPYLNSMEMLNATEEKRIEMLRKAMKDSGQTFDSLSRRQREALANTLGLGEAATQALFRDENIKSLDELRKKTEAGVEGEKELVNQSKDLLTFQEKMQRTMENSARAMTIMGKGLKDLAAAMKNLNVEGDESTGWLASFGSTLMSIAEFAANVGMARFGFKGMGKMLKKLPGAGAVSNAFSKVKDKALSAGKSLLEKGKGLVGKGAAAGAGGATSAASGAASGAASSAASSAASGAASGAASSATSAASASANAAKATASAASATTKVGGAAAKAAAALRGAGATFLAAIKSGGMRAALGGALKGALKRFLPQYVVAEVGWKIGSTIGGKINEGLRKEKSTVKRGVGESKAFEKPGSIMPQYEADEDILGEAGQYISRWWKKKGWGFAEGKPANMPSLFQRALLGERGPELLFDHAKGAARGAFRMAGLFGPEIAPVSKTAEIFPSQQTSGMLSTMENFSDSIAKFFNFSSGNWWERLGDKPKTEQASGDQRPINIHVTLEVDGEKFGTLVETITSKTITDAFAEA